MKIKELRAMNKRDMQDKLTELKKELMKIRVQSRTSTPKSPGRIRLMKKTMARILTLTNKKYTGGKKKG